MACKEILQGPIGRSRLRPNDADRFGAFQREIDRLMSRFFKIIGSRRSGAKADAAGKEDQKCEKQRKGAQRRQP